MLEFNNKDMNLLILLSEIATIEQLARNKLDNALPKDLNISSFSVLNHFSGSRAEKTPLQLARSFHVLRRSLLRDASGLNSGPGARTTVPCATDPPTRSIKKAFGQCRRPQKNKKNHKKKKMIKSRVAQLRERHNHFYRHFLCVFNLEN